MMTRSWERESLYIIMWWLYLSCIICIAEYLRLTLTYVALKLYFWFDHVTVLLFFLKKTWIYTFSLPEEQQEESRWLFKTWMDHIQSARGNGDDTILTKRVAYVTNLCQEVGNTRLTWSIILPKLPLVVCRRHTGMSKGEGEQTNKSLCSWTAAGFTCTHIHIATVTVMVLHIRTLFKNNKQNKK